MIIYFVGVILLSILMRNYLSATINLTKINQIL